MRQVLGLHGDLCICLTISFKHTLNFKGLSLSQKRVTIRVPPHLVLMWKHHGHCSSPPTLMLPSCREIHRLSAEIDSHVMRAAVLLETIETLQAGGDNEQEQRLVGLTAQLAAAHGQAAAQEARTRALLVSSACSLLIHNCYLMLHLHNCQSGSPSVT